MNANLAENNNRKKVRVALVAPSLRNVGGQSVQARRLLDAFENDEQAELTFIANEPLTPLQNIKFVRTIFSSIKFWYLLLKKIPAAEIVHIFSSGTTSYIISTLPPLIIAKILGKKTILNYHTGEAEEHLTKWKKTAKPTMKKFDEIVVPSNFLVDVFAKFDLPAKVVFNLVENKNFKFRERQPLKPVFLSNRNFEAHYQVADVLRAFQIVQNKIPEAKLIVAGFGSEEAKLKNLARALKLENIEFLGRVSQNEMPEIYDRADIYLNSSIVDNMPLSIIEAFSCGLPVISSDAGGIPYICENGENALLVEKNNYEALAREAVEILENDDLAKKIIAKARLDCVKYFCENVRGDWLNIYLNLVSTEIPPQ